MRSFSCKQRSGFTLVEVLVAISIFVLVSISVYKAFGAILEGSRVSRIKLTASALANEHFEVIRNLSYNDIGIVGGVPAGKIPYQKNITRNGATFTLTSYVQNIDDPHDGSFGGNPNDTYPIDSKLVQVEVACVNCDQPPLIFTTRIAPPSLEELGSNGILIVKVFDAFGQPLQGANIHIENNIATTSIEINDVTDVDGTLKIIGIPPGLQAYEITVSKNGYSTDQTYAQGDPQNPVPDKIHSTVLDGQITQISFSIDKLSTLVLKTRTETCSGVGNVDVHLTGSKTIGLNTYKYDNTVSTGGSGSLTLPNMEWDTYTLNVTDNSYYLAGSNPNTDLELNPDITQTIDLIVEPSSPNGVLVQVLDSGTRLPIADVEVEISGPGGTVTKMTGQGSLYQTDWSGGSGQVSFSDIKRFFTTDGNLEINDPAGTIKLAQFSGSYITSGTLESSTFDTGTTTNFHAIKWEPQNSATSTDVRFQFASNAEITATTTWDFKGPNGSSGTYYTSSGQNISSAHNGTRYFRYKMFLDTTDTSVTPIISDVATVFSGDCVPTGEALFKGLTAGDYDISISRAGYVTYDLVDYPIANGWQKITILLTQ